MATREPSPLSTPDSFSSETSEESTSSSLTSPRTPPNLHQNSTDPTTKWLVQKFGGTSVGKFVEKIAEDVVSFVLLPFAALTTSILTRPRNGIYVATFSSVLRDLLLTRFTGITLTNIRSPSCALHAQALQKPSVPQIFY